MAEKIIGPFAFSVAEKLVAKLMDASGAFRGGANPLVGRLKKSYGYGKIIGVKSFDNKVSVRIDFEPDTLNKDGNIIKGKGYHFNYVNDNTGEKICILIKDIGEKFYQGYIDRLTLGRSLIISKKGPILKITKDINTKKYYDSKHDSYFDYVDKLTGKKVRIVIKELLKAANKDTINMLLESKFVSFLDINVSDDVIDELIILDSFHFLYAVEMLDIMNEENKKDKGTKSDLYKEHIPEILYNIINHVLLPMSNEVKDYNVTGDYSDFSKKVPKH